ncbi:hypothetical protein Bca4012_095079 [Brassica carinata]|uniref:No apical meristem-associated C-terminal domain-containing protein n=1 Tax=Brassica carinata TaxID=52824 RepID=A0A8X7TXY2_BRACI|nr:hypothetical protein Bca52824_077113 [Brassica carinata]
MESLSRWFSSAIRRCLKCRYMDGSRCTIQVQDEDKRRLKRKGDDGGGTSNSQGTEPKRPAGVKASKASGKKNMVEEKALKEFESMWAIKQHDLATKEKLSRMSLLDSLLAKKRAFSRSDYCSCLTLCFRSGQCEKMEQWEWNNHGVSVVLRSWRLVSRSFQSHGVKSCCLGVLKSCCLVVLECCSTCVTE